MSLSLCVEHQHMIHSAYCHYASITSKLQKHFSKISMKENEIIDLSEIVNTRLDENGVTEAWDSNVNYKSGIKIVSNLHGKLVSKVINRYFANN